MTGLFLANTASPLTHATMILLLGMNVVIGLVEGFIIAGMQQSPPFRTMGLMVVANYASMILGIVIFGLGLGNGMVGAMVTVPLWAVPWFFWASVVVAFALSILVEWPFARGSTSAEARPPRRITLRAMLIAHVVSYLFLGFLYNYGDVTIGRDVAVVDVEAFGDELPVGLIYFLDEEDQSLNSMALDGSGLTHLADVEVTPRTVLGWNALDAGDDDVRWELQLNGFHPRDHELVSVAPSGRRGVMSREPLMAQSQPALVSERTLHYYLSSFGGVVELRDIAEGSQEWIALPRGSSGIECGLARPGRGSWIEYTHGISRNAQEYDVRNDSPFAIWWASSVTLIPGDFAVFELGGRICILHMPTRRMAKIGNGRSPAVLLTEHEPFTLYRE